MDPEKKKFGLDIFPTKYVIPKSLKFSHWPTKFLRLHTPKKPTWQLKTNHFEDVYPIQKWWFSIVMLFFWAVFPNSPRWKSGSSEFQAILSIQIQFTGPFCLQSTREVDFFKTPQKMGSPWNRWICWHFLHGCFQNGWFIVDNLIKMDDLRGRNPYFWKYTTFFDPPNKKTGGYFFLQGLLIHMQTYSSWCRNATEKINLGW